MNPSEKVISDFEKITCEFQEVLSSFSREQINEIPFEGSWTPGKVGRHVYKALVNMPKIIQGPVTQTERKPDELVEPISKIFLDFTIRLQAPEFIIPEDKDYNREELVNAFENKIREIVDAAKPLDLTGTTGFQLPKFGHLTRLELIYFAGVHTQRHIWQLKKIHEHLAATAS